MFKEKIGTFLDILGDYSKLLFILITIILGVSLYRNFTKVKSSKDRIEQARRKVEELKDQNTKLKRNLQEKESEEFIERELRNKLNLARKDEIVLVLPDDEILRKLAPEKVEEQQDLPDPNWKKWLKLFF